MEQNKLELQHHGTKGMRWGVRKYQNKDGSLTPAGKKRYGDGGDKKEGSTNSKYGRKSSKQMTDAELKEKIARLRLEKEYKDLSKETTSRGKAFTLRVLEKIGENTLVNLGTQAANKGLGEAINKMFGVDSGDTVKRIVNPNKGQSDKK